MKSLFTLVFITFSFTTIFAQHIKINKKELLFLRNEPSINVVFNYDTHTRGGDHISEKEYIKNWTKTLTNKSKDTSVWHNAYLNSKNKIWQETYVNNLNSNLIQYISPEFKLNSNSDFTLLINVLWIYSGYDIGIAKSPSKIKLELDVIDNNTKKIIQTIEIKESRGENKDSDNDSLWPDLKLVENAFKNSAFKLAITLRRVFEKH